MNSILFILVILSYIFNKNPDEDLLLMSVKTRICFLEHAVQGTGRSVSHSTPNGI